MAKVYKNGTAIASFYEAEYIEEHINDKFTIIAEKDDGDKIKMLIDKTKKIFELEETIKEKNKLIEKLSHQIFEDRCKKMGYSKIYGESIEKLYPVIYASKEAYKKRTLPKVDKVITDNPPYTTILFEDGTKQVVKYSKNEKYYTNEKGEKVERLDKEYDYDRDKGIMIALFERIYGKKEFYKIMGWK